MTEADVQLHVCQYLRLQYPQVLFRSDYASGLKLTMYQAKRHASLQSGRAWPDLMLYEPRGNFVGLALELKRDGTTILKRNGELVSSPHIQEQAHTLKTLAKCGWMGQFAIGFEQAKHFIDQYMQ